jgi:hypothetical protein
MVGSKLDGTGLENEHIGHTQVPTTADDWVGTVLEGRKGLAEREDGEEEDVSLWNDGDRGVLVLVTEPNPRFNGFGTNVIFADDLRKPAY